MMGQAERVDAAEDAEHGVDHRGGDLRGKAVCGSPDKPLIIGDTEIECYVLDDGTRVITQAAFLSAIGKHPRAMGRRDASDGLPPILRSAAIQPFITEAIRLAVMVEGSLQSGSRPQRCHGGFASLDCRVQPTGPNGRNRPLGEYWQFTGHRQRKCIAGSYISMTRLLLTLSLPSNPERLTKSLRRLIQRVKEGSAEASECTVPRLKVEKRRPQPLRKRWFGSGLDSLCSIFGTKA